jgi:aquaporin TIP
VESTGRAAVAEFVATFALVVVGAGAAVLYANGQLDLTGVALANGLVLSIMVSVTAHLSGGFANPAVAIALWVTGRLPTVRALALILAQLMGAVAAAFSLKALVPPRLFAAAAAAVPSLAPGTPPSEGMLIEALATFLLVFAVFGTAVDDRGPWSKTGGLTIGLALTFDVLAFAPYTGAATNPARWFGPALAGGGWSTSYVWILGPIGGAIIGGVLYWWTFLWGKEPATP